MNPGVDVVVATRDRPELLRRTLDAIARQRYDGPVVTTVVFDQCAPDESLQGVHVITNTRTPGLPGARNSGIAAGSQPLIAFCDDDDVWLPGKLAAQVSLLSASPDVEVATTGIFVVSRRRVTPRVVSGGWVTHRDLLRSRMLEAHPSTYLVRRTALDAIGPVDEAIPGGFGEDYDWLLRAARRHPIAAVPLPLVEVLWARTSFFTDRWRTIDAALDYLVERHPELRDDSRGLARIVGQQAFARAAVGERRAAVSTAVRSLRLHPAEPRAFLAMLVASGVVSPDAVLRSLHRFGRSV